MDIRELASFLVGKVVLRRELCTKSLSPRASCQRCAESCPLGGIEITGEGPEIIDCNRCGLCAAVCPTGALKDPERTPAFFLARGREILKIYEEVVFFCPRSPYRIRQEKAGNLVFVPCLGALPPEVLLALAVEGRITLILPKEGCRGCALQKGQEIFENNFSVLHMMLEALALPPGRIKLTPEISRGRVKPGHSVGLEVAMGRRELFAALFRNIKRWEREENEGRARIPSTRREILHQALVRLEREGGLPQENRDWPQAGLKVVGPCYFCNVCSRLCPAGALILEEERLLFKPSLCLSCGLCLDVCLHRSLSWGDKVSLKSITTRERQELAVVTVKECINCGEKFSANIYAQLCLRCSLQRPNPSFNLAPNLGGNGELKK
ncbi:4Fe-4S binding domain-containing protein [Thermanaeromonas toyohensis ToBE]|uniref:4Fe-4S binding domain-containing protein n=1 Tax=Thermanaeromonas toyohensis ToBE TaxID=698762 RepID=A0A1W1VYR0_9FIRM|nr:4Fe-4S binding protein [Thermanaeromonas toyohensis]SMB98476.1 4Fe-4S binding domain-containing protein [Thermanaeromonas toyohensis ToBE]